MKREKCGVYLVSNSHIDVAWLWTKEETLKVCLRTFIRALDFIEKYGIVYAQSNIIFYEWMEKYYPEIFGQIKKRIREGKWEVVGGSWVECDTNLPLGESLIRQFLYGIMYVRKKFGTNIKIAWFPDSFGFPISLPKILRHVGIRFFLTSKLSWNDTTRFPYYLFLWCADDGSEVLAYQSVGPYNDEFDAKKAKKYIDKIYKRHKVCSLLFLYGRGDHGGGPTKKDIKNMRRAPKDIILLVEKAERFFSDIYEDINFSDMSIPKVEDELYLQFHRGVYTTQRIIKTLMRLCEVSILDTEFLLVLSEIYGLSREKINLEKIWKTILTNQFHDILSGALSKDATAESLSELKKALIKTEKVKNKIIRKIVNCFRKPREDSILIINPTQWSRDLIISLPNKEEFGKIANVPGFGVKIVPVDKIVKKGSVLVRDREKFIILENNKYRVFVDKRTGLLSQVFDKMLRKKLLKAPIRIRIFDDYPSWKRDNMVGYPAAIFDAWEIFTFDNESRYTDLLDPVDVAVEENNSLRAAIRTRYKYRQGISSAIFEICYVLDDASDSVGIEIKASWKSKHKLAKIILPLNTNTEYAIYGAPYGVVKRVDYSSEQASVAEKAKYEVPTVGWIQIPNKKWSISVAIDSSVGVSKDKSNLGITLLRSPTFPSMEKLKMVTLIPKCIRDRIIANKKIMYLLNHLQTLIESITKNYMDQGKHRISIKIKSYLGTKHTEAIKLWNELNRKCYVVRTEGEKFSSKIIEIIPKDVLISAIKPAEKDDGIILRLWNPNNSHKEARIILSRKIRGAYLCNGTEDIIKKLETTNNEIRIKIHKNQIKTIKII